MRQIIQAASIAHSSLEIQIKFFMSPTRKTFLISSLEPKRKISALLAVIFFSVHFANAVTFQIVDPAEFSKIINTNAVVTTNYTINSPLEGPVWVPSDGGYLVFSDMGNNRLKKLVPPGTVTDFFVPPANTLFNAERPRKADD